MRKPNFDNLLKVLRLEAPDRPTLFEFFLNGPLYEHLAGEKTPPDAHNNVRFLCNAFANAGYDYATVSGSAFHFASGKKRRAQTFAVNDNAIIFDRESFDDYEWPDPEAFDYSAIQDAEPPEGMKLMVCGPGGVLENVMSLMGYDNMCMAMYDDPQLVFDVFEQIGSRMLGYYERSVKHKSVGVLMSNDDWGFNTQTMISPADMKKYVFPWHQKFVELAHNTNIPAVLHSCGNFDEIMDDTIDVLKYDGKHSYEDNILPVEDAYRKWGGRIAILGGIDIHFVATGKPEEITARCKAMLDLGKAGYALGTGNSVPEYIPWENYFAMTKAVQ